MSNQFSAKCDLCGASETSDKAYGLTMTRFVMNVETKHSCAPCWDVLRAVFKTGIGGVKEPLAKINALMSEKEILKANFDAERRAVKNAEQSLEWKNEEYERDKERLAKDLEGVLQKLRDVSAKYSLLMSAGKSILEEFGGFRKLLDEAKAKWTLGFWKTLSFFDRSKAEFQSRADSILGTMHFIESAWPKDKQPPPASGPKGPDGFQGFQGPRW